jgi:hypothetical protein
MADRITIHIGTMKSGTTYLQNVLRGFDEPLREAGWLYPTTWESGREVPSHERAIGGIVGSAIPWVTLDTQVSRRPAWERLHEAAGAWDGPVLLSAEALAVMDPPGIETLLRALPGTGFRIVLTARDLGRVLPSSWQQHIRNGRTDSYDDYLSAIRIARDDPASAAAGNTFWRSYRLTDVVRRWQAGPGVEEVVVATVPRSAPPAELWLRFREAVGLPSSVPGAPPEVPRVLAHVGATAPEALIVEAFVRQLEAQGVPPAVRAARVRRVMVDALLPRSERGTPLRLPARWVDEIAGWAREDLDGLRGLGVRVVGSLDDLQVTDRGVDGPIAPPEEVAAAAAVALLHDRGPARQRRIRKPLPQRVLARLLRRPNDQPDS